MRSAPSASLDSHPDYHHRIGHGYFGITSDYRSGGSPGSSPSWRAGRVRAGKDFPVGRCRRGCVVPCRREDPALRSRGSVLRRPDGATSLRRCDGVSRCGGGPADAEFIATGAEFADELGQRLVAGFAAGFGAEYGDGIVGDLLPVREELVGAWVEKEEPRRVRGSARVFEQGSVQSMETSLEGIADAYAAMDERRAIKSLVRVGTV